jgi:hypothetical protein
MGIGVSSGGGVGGVEDGGASEVEAAGVGVDGFEDELGLEDVDAQPPLAIVVFPDVTDGVEG